MRPEHAHLDKGRAHMSMKKKPWEGGGYEWQLGEYPHSYCTSPVHKLYNAVSYNMGTCTLYNMVTSLLQSLDQSTTDNYQLKTLKHCIISPVNTHKYCTYQCPWWELHCDMFQRTVSVSQRQEQWQRVDGCDGQFPELTHCLTTCGHS